jgi:segregation and condensation protein B
MNIEPSRKQLRLATLEATLYVAGRPLEIDRLMQVIGTKSERIAFKLVDELSARISERGGALEVKHLPGRRAVLQLKQEYNDMVKQLTNRPLLTIGPLKTLSYIAYHQPVEQSQVLIDRGAHVYPQLRLIEDLGLITRERIEDRNVIIRTTSFFADYFGFSQNPAKSKFELQQIFNTLKIHEAENGVEPSLDQFNKDVGILANSRGGLPEGLPQYPGTTN